VGSLGSPPPPYPSSFPTGKAVLTKRRPPVLACRVHPLVSFTPLQSTAVSLPAPGLPAHSTFHGVAFPLRDINQKRPCGGRPNPTAFPSATFLTSPTVSSAPDLVGLFHPTATSRVCSSGVNPLAQPVHLVGTPVPSRRWRTAAADSYPPAPRLRVPPAGLSSMREFEVKPGSC